MHADRMLCELAVADIALNARPDIFEQLDCQEKRSIHMGHRLNLASGSSFGPQTRIWARFPFARFFCDPSGSWRSIACFASVLLVTAAPTSGAGKPVGHRITSFYGVDLGVRKDDQKKNFKGFKLWPDQPNSWIKDGDMQLIVKLDEKDRVIMISAVARIDRKDCNFMKGIHDAIAADYPGIPSMPEANRFIIAESLSKEGAVAAGARGIMGMCFLIEGGMPMMQLIARLSSEEIAR